MFTVMVLAIISLILAHPFLTILIIVLIAVLLNPGIIYEEIIDMRRNNKKGG